MHVNSHHMPVLQNDSKSSSLYNSLQQRQHLAILSILINKSTKVQKTSLYVLIKKKEIKKKVGGLMKSWLARNVTIVGNVLINEGKVAVCQLS